MYEEIFLGFDVSDDKVGMDVCWACFNINAEKRQYHLKQKVREWDFVDEFGDLDWDKYNDFIETADFYLDLPFDLYPKEVIDLTKDNDIEVIDLTKDDEN